MDSKSAVCTNSMHCMAAGKIKVNDIHFKNSQGLPVSQDSIDSTCQHVSLVPETRELALKFPSCLK